MNWLDIVNNSELVYASTSEDKGFRIWSLKKTTCNVSFYESHPIENIDKIICTIIKNAGGTITEERLANVLGFNVVDNFDVTPKRYADNAELDIFRAILKPVIDWGLLIKEKETKIYLLTELGRRTLEKEMKFRFFTGGKILFENSNIKPFELQENIFFPFYFTLGISSEITNKQQIKYDKISPVEVFDIDETDLIRRHKLQSKEIYQLYKSEITNYFSFESCQVDFRLFKQGSDYYPIIFYNNQISIEATDLLYLPENIREKEKKKEWGLYLKLIKDPNAILDYEMIIPFVDLLDLDNLIKDTRLVWGDNELFNFVAQNANANQWHAISNQCPIDVIKIHIDKHKDFWDWTSLSLRIDDEFLIETAVKYPWNFEAISTRKDISIQILKFLLLIPELRDQEWDWVNIMPQLDFEFIKSNIEKIDFELSDLTKANINDVQSLIIQYPGKKWNWAYISTNYELAYILDNLLVFKKYIQLKSVVNRAFISNEFVGLYCKSLNFKALLNEAKETVLRDYSPNQAKYVWTTDLIDLLDNTKYLTWESGTYTLGFECNTSINWSYDFFQKYNSKITTNKGFSFVSQNVRDKNIVLDYIDFNWDWNEISNNSSLISDKEFILSILDKLNFAFLLQNIDSETLELLLSNSDILSFLEQNPTSWLPVTEKASIVFVRNHIDYNWDWRILTKRFCSSIKIEALGNSKWIDKWDWKYLTRNLDLSNVYNNLALYTTYWDWEYLTENLDREFILNNLQEYSTCLNWNILIIKRLDKSDLLLTSHLVEVAMCISVLEVDLQKVLWQIITRKFDNTELEILISTTHKNQFFHWDYAYFYDLPNFNLRSYLQNFSEYVHWKELSGCKKLEETFRYDEKLFSEQVWRKDIIQQLDSYKWDFQSLSKIDSVSSDYNILNRYKERWDWDYLTLYSSYFFGLNLDSRKIKSFKQNVNFTLLSQRETAGLTEKIISEYIDKQWDWIVLSSNKSIHFSKEFILENKEKQWNWAAISIRTDIKLDNKALIELSEKNWDWDAISNRTDIIFSEEIIKQLKDKPLNWVFVSQKKSFIPNAITLSILKGNTLDWDAISRNENLSTDCLWDYREKLNWQKITKGKIFEISDSELLFKYRDFIDWRFISNSDKFKLTFDNLNRFRDWLHWGLINTRYDFSISDEILEPFADVLDWSKVSQSMDITITDVLIEKYSNKWDWSLLRKNPQVIVRLETSLKKYSLEFNCADFVDKFNEQAYIYHFTHLFNAIDIITSRKILSRHKTEGKFANAAGSLVDRRSTAHNFARFYFRPQTPTQFYNECLGKDSYLDYYQQARNMKLPKCPLPVFFKFDLKEVIRKMPLKCYYSTGNMQSNWARVEKVSDNPNAINIEYLYSNVSDYENYKHYSQQEFLIIEEFDFSALDSFEIICYDDEQAKILKTQLGKDPICQKINSNGRGIFHRGNRELNIHETDTEVIISCEYRDNAYLSIKGEGLRSIQIQNPENIKKETATEILAYPEIRFTKTEQAIEVHFVDLETQAEDGKPNNWLIFSNCSNFNMNSLSVNNTVFKISDSVINTFSQLKIRLILELTKDLYYSHMVESYHGIAHTTRVLFGSCLLLNYMNDVSEETKDAIYYSAIIHDLGKTSDREGSIHGEKSANLYKSKIEQIILDKDLQELAIAAIKYHSIEDNECPENVKRNIIWKVLKDADALDRGRFSKKCDKSYLRLEVFKTEEGNRIIEFMDKLPYITKNLNWENPYLELIDCIKQVNK